MLATHEAAPVIQEDSALRKFFEQTPGLLAGGTAILLQVAHPAVGAGVHLHSNFRGASLSRLVSTMDLVLTIVYGTPEQANQIAKRVHAIHAKVSGTIPETGEEYDARERRTQLWVWATLVHVAFDFHERFIKPITPEFKAAVYEDWCRFAVIFGIDQHLVPPSVSDFDEYWEGMICQLQVTESAKQVAEFIVYSPLGQRWWLPFPDKWQRGHEIITLGLLPPAIREQYGFPFNEQIWEKVQASLRRMYGGAGRAADKQESESVLSLKPLRRRMLKSTMYAAPRVYVASKRWGEAASKLWPRARL